ncbi:MAG: HAD-IA family hydrolase [Oscillochloris sp.]|nr:HAD-IA family hydrolase [Oscillochloris sp.]
MICALILDFDGLIVDTETPALASWQHIYAEYGHELPLAVWAGALGTNHGFDAFEYLVGLVAAVNAAAAAELRQAEEAVRDRRQELKTALSADKPLLPGVIALLDQADAAGLPLAVASSSSRRWVAGWLRTHGIYERFVCVRTSDDVEYTKPDPALFLAAAAGLGYPPGACLVFEDSPNGILAARAAGCPVIAVPSVITSQIALPPADLVISALDAHPLSEMLARFG